MEIKKVTRFVSVSIVTLAVQPVFGQVCRDDHLKEIVAHARAREESLHSIELILQEKSEVGQPEPTGGTSRADEDGLKPKMIWQSTKKHRSLKFSQEGETWRLEESTPSEPSLGRQVNTCDGKFYTSFAVKETPPVPGRGMGSLYRSNPLFGTPLVGLYSVENRNLSDFLAGCALVSKSEASNKVKLFLETENRAKVQLVVTKDSQIPEEIRIVREGREIKDETVIQMKSKLVGGVAVPLLTTYNRTVSIHGTPHDFERHQYSVDSSKVNDKEISVDLVVPSGQTFQEVSEPTKAVSFYIVDDKHQLESVSANVALGLNESTSSFPWQEVVAGIVLLLCGRIFFRNKRRTQSV